MSGIEEVDPSPPGSLGHRHGLEVAGSTRVAAAARLVTIDLFCPEAMAAARVLLPQNNANLGATSASSMRLSYISDPPPRTASSALSCVEFNDWNNVTLVELRVSTACTEVPVSHGPRPGPPLRIDWQDVETAFQEIAAISLLARANRKPDIRKAIRRATSAFLLSSGWTVERTARFMGALAASSGGSEPGSRVLAEVLSVSRCAPWELKFGFQWLAELAGHLVAVSMARELGLEHPASVKASLPAALVHGEAFSPASYLAGLPVPQRAWLVPELIPMHKVTLLGGDGGTGKSLIALQLAAAAALGRLWIGQEVRQGRALYLSAEDDEEELHRRLADIAASEGVDLAEFGDLAIRSMVGQDPLLAVPDRSSGLLSTTPFLAELDAHMAESRPALLVLDTLADLHGGRRERPRPCPAVHCDPD
jgi:AAA domain